MIPAALRAWQAQMGYTYETAAEALGMSRSGFAKLLAGDHPIDKRTALACAAIAAGLGEWPRSGSAHDLDELKGTA
jgi:transcriptional regulator with XRE-family HTH domain